MKKHKKSKRDQATEKLDLLMQELETTVEPGKGSAPGSCHRIYCI